MSGQESMDSRIIKSNKTFLFTYELIHTIQKFVLLLDIRSYK